jgi:transposase InsO family protein
MRSDLTEVRNTSTPNTPDAVCLGGSGGVDAGVLDVVCDRLGLSAQARAVIAEIRAAPPTRRVRSAAGNVAVRFPSHKMGVIIQAESHRCELAGVYEYEHDPATLAFYDQPPSIPLSYAAPTGRRVRVWHTPDYFVMRAHEAGWEEWKAEEALVWLAGTMPHRYVRDAETGRWRCPPGEAHAAPLGLFYRVRSSAEIDWVLQRNLRFLADYLRVDALPPPEDATRAVLALVTRQPGLRLDALLGLLQAAGAFAGGSGVPGVSSDAVYALVAHGRVYVDLRAAPLAEPDRVRVFADQTAARVAAAERPATDLPPAALAGDAASVGGVAAGERRAASNAACERLAQASPADLCEANRRYAIIAPHLAHLIGRPAVPADPAAATADAPAAVTPARTVRHWLARWRTAEHLHGCGYVGLLPRRAQGGNRTRKLPAATLQVLDEFLATDYETLKQKRRFAVYAALVRASEARGVTAPSYKTFALAANRRPREDQVRRRQGPRAAAQVAPFQWELALTTPRHGDRPFEIGHLDHTQLDVELVCSRTGRPLGRPWATFLSDAYSRRLLAVCLLFDPPSYRSCLLALRECVRRHERLPETVVVDGGPEFSSVYFETLLARYGCAKKTRPPAQPRYGSVCERLFGTTNTRFVHTLAGNTQLRRQSRLVTKAVDPAVHACWTLGALAERLATWAYEVYDTLDHPALGQSPREAFADGLQQSGQRPQRRIAYDEDFRLLTLPTTAKGTAKLQPRLGVKIHHLYYWADAFVAPEVEGTPVPVRYDPFDAGLAYAFVQGRWVRCISEHHARFAGRSEREIQLASAELRRRQQRHGQHLRVTARALADFLASLDAEEVLLEQRLRDAEARHALLPTAPTFTAAAELSVPTALESACSAATSTRDTAGECVAPTGPTGSPTSRRDDTNALVIYEDY